jgi:hypothetical protein
VAGDVAADIGAGDAGLAAEHRDDRLVDAVLCDPAGAVGEQEVGVLVCLAVEHRRLSGSDGLPCFDGLAQEWFDGFGGDVHDQGEASGRWLRPVVRPFATFRDS